MMFVAPSESQMPVPANDTCIMFFAKSTGRMQHVLMRCSDVATGSVVVSAEVSRHATPFRCSKQELED